MIGSIIGNSLSLWVLRVFVTTRIMFGLGLCVLLPHARPFQVCCPVPHRPEPFQAAQWNSGEDQVLFLLSLPGPSPHGPGELLHNPVFSRTNGVPPPQISSLLSGAPLSLQQILFQTPGLPEFSTASPLGSLRGSAWAPFPHLLWETLPGRRLGPSQAPLCRASLSQSTQQDCLPPVS